MEGDSYMTIGDLRFEGLKRLSHVESRAIDRDLILSFVLGKDRSYLISYGEEKVSREKEEEYYKLLEERGKGKPVAYITGEKEFLGRPFLVTKDTLIPRPDTEILVEEAKERLKEYIKEKNIDLNKVEIQILDMCSGSGNIGISLACDIENSKVTLSDVSKGAIEVSKKNGARHLVSQRVSYNLGNLFQGLNGMKFDLIVSNPPYIGKDELLGLDKGILSYEPIIALDGGQDGLDFYKRIINEACIYLKEGGVLAFEIGYNQGDLVSNLIEKRGNYKDIRVKKDLSGLNRVVSAVKK